MKQSEINALVDNAVNAVMFLFNGEKIKDMPTNWLKALKWLVDGELEKRKRE